MTIDTIKDYVGEAITKTNKIVAVAKSASDAYPDNADRMLELVDVIVDYSVSLSKDLNNLYENIDE